MSSQVSASSQQPSLGKQGGQSNSVFAKNKQKFESAQGLGDGPLAQQSALKKIQGKGAPVQSNLSPIKKDIQIPKRANHIANAKSDLNLSAADGPRAGANSTANSENNLFNKHYNKELKLCEDEIPMVLQELNESALAYLSRDQFENALLLLQKAHGVLDAVDLSGSKRDLLIALQLFHNMAMCYQKQGQLEECALCLETTLDHLGTDYANMKSQSFAMRIFKIKLEAKLRLQFCAILSQLHRHKEALEQAQEGIKLAHLIIRDKISVCRYYSKRIDIKANEPPTFTEKIESLSHSEATKSRKESRIFSKRGQDNSKSSNFFLEEDEFEKWQMIKDSDNISEHSIGQYQTKQGMYNNLEDQISLTEKTAKKLLPIYQEVLLKVKVIERLRTQKTADSDVKNKEVSENESSDTESKIGNGFSGLDSKKKNNRKSQMGQRGGKKEEKSQKQAVDLRHILGFLNQTEWIQNLNIGNIMQIAPIRLEELSQIRQNEDLLARDSFLEVISFLIVGYFCASTEIRFIIQLKDEIGKFQSFSIPDKTQQSELWHTMSLDIACSFLPSDCPLLNHILLSYQKHHAPSQANIPENEVLDEQLRVIKPLTGIDNSKFQPIIRELKEVTIELPLAKIKPVQQVVNKMLRDIQKQTNTGEEYAQGGNGNTPVAQQSNMSKSPKKKLKNFQVQKMIKLEKIIGKFAKDVGYEKKELLKLLIGDRGNDESKNANILDNQQAQELSSEQQLSGRPRSTQEKSTQRQHLDSANTGIAAKIAYNNLGKYVDLNNDPNNNHQASNHNSINSASSQSNNFRNSSSPTSQLESRNAKNSFLNLEQDKQNGVDSMTEPSSQAIPIRSQRQQNLIRDNNETNMRIYDSETSQRDNLFQTDLSQIAINHHDKSMNEQLDEKNKFILNQGDLNAQQHHNLSIGAIGQVHGSSHSGTVRQQSKRIHSQERGKIQRPRSSKGYRGSQNNNSNNQMSQQSLVNNGHIGPSHHQMSAHHLPSGQTNNLVNTSMQSQGPTPNQKLLMSKSEERALKSQQNQRSIIKQGQRQKTAGGHAVNMNQQHGFSKDLIAAPSQKNTALASLYKDNQIQSQSSTQLPSAQLNNNFSKLSKKQMQQIAQQQALLNQANSQAQLGPNQANNFNSLNNLKQNPKMKMNYEDLKKFLVKEYSASQAQYILQQHANGQIIQGIPGTQSQQQFAAMNNIDNSVQQQPQISGQTRSSSTNNGQKQKKIIQSQNQIPGVNQPSVHTNLQNVGSLDKFDQIQVNLDGQINYNFMNGIPPTQNKDLKELNAQSIQEQNRDRLDNAREIHLKQKPKQTLAQARKSSQQNNGNHQQSAQLISSLQASGSNTQGSQAQQIYLNSLQQSVNIRPNSNHNNSNTSSHHGSLKQSASSNGRQPKASREVSSKSALGTIGMTMANHQNITNSANNNSSSNSIKRREKGRLIMQEWLTKSGQPPPQNPTQTTQQQTQAQLSSLQQQAHTQMNNSSSGSKNKFIQQQMGLNQLNSAQIQLTKQQQQQLHEIQLQKQNVGISQNSSVRGDRQALEAQQRQSQDKLFDKRTSNKHNI